MRGSWPSANRKRQRIWTWKPQGGFEKVFSSLFFFRYLKKKLEAGRRNGLELTGDELEEFKLVKKRISELGIAFGLHQDQDLQK